MDALTNIWTWVLPIGGGITIGGIIVAIGIVILKATFNKAVEKLGINKFVQKVEDTQHEAADKAVEKVKEISFKQTIQPLVESELKKVTETANAYIEEKVDGLQKSNYRIVDALEAFAALFDDSIVPDAKKEALRNAIQAAKEVPTTQDIKVEVAEQPEVPTTTKNTKKSGVTR